MYNNILIIANESYSDEVTGITLSGDNSFSGHSPSLIHNNSITLYNNDEDETCWFSFGDYHAGIYGKRNAGDDTPAFAIQNTITTFGSCIAAIGNEDGPRVIWNNVLNTTHKRSYDLYLNELEKLIISSPSPIGQGAGCLPSLGAS